MSRDIQPQADGAYLTLQRRRRDLSTQVMLPRFETETDEFKIYKRQLHRVQAHPWLPLVEVRALLKPQTVDEKGEWVNVRSNWWGASHQSRTSQTAAQFQAATFANARPELYRTKYIEHSYLWDHQAFDGSCTEIVLERQVGWRAALGLQQQNGFREVMAMNVSNRSWEGASQQLVMMNHRGQRVEADPDQADPRRDHLLAVMCSLATYAANNSPSAQEDAEPILTSFLSPGI